MFVIDLQYIVPLEELDAIMKDHIQFLNKYYKKGIFIVSGRKVPRTGGIILAVGDDKKVIEKIMKEDPFTKNGLADYTIIEFKSSQYNEVLKDVLNA